MAKVLPTQRKRTYAKRGPSKKTQAAETDALKHEARLLARLGVDALSPANLSPLGIEVGSYRSTKSEAAILDALESGECQCMPYRDVQTSGRWRAAGLKAKGGNKAIARIGRYGTTPVWCRCQVEPMPSEAEQAAQRGGKPPTFAESLDTLEQAAHGQLSALGVGITHDSAAEVLGIPPKQAEALIEYLIARDLLEFTGEGWQATVIVEAEAMPF